MPTCIIVALLAKPPYVLHDIVSEVVSPLELLRPHHLLSDGEESLLQLNFEAERCMARQTVSPLYAAGAHGCKRPRPGWTRPKTSRS